MNVFNSPAGLYQDDTDMTMMNHSFIYGGNDESIGSCIPIVRRQQANQSKSITNPSNSDESYPDPLGSVHQIEQILNFYRQDLKQESKTQLDCNRQLITRLIDFLRPIYSSNENQMKDLDILYKEILDLQDLRFVEQKEKNDQLSTQIRYLKKSIIASPIEDDNRDSLMTNVYRMNTMIDYEQWLEIEEETKQLYQLVKTQREYIDQLVEILSSRDDHIPSLEKPVDTTADVVDIPVPTEPEQCPFCSEKFPDKDEIGYIEHLSRCFNDMNGNL